LQTAPVLRLVEERIEQELEVQRHDDGGDELFSLAFWAEEQ
jgi:hypothetical protein